MNPKNRTLIIVLSAIGLVVIVGAIAFLLSGDDDEADTATGSGSATTVEADSGTDVPATTAAGGEIRENQPVAVTGQMLPPLEDPATDGSIGLPTPVADGASFDGTPITIGGPTDGASMYVFLAHWCPHCNDEIPELIELEQRGAIPAGVNIVGISTAVAADRPNYPPSEWLADKGWPWPVLADSEELTAFIGFGGSGFPYTVLAAADGTVLARSAGSRSADDIESWLNDALAGQPV